MPVLYISRQEIIDREGDRFLTSQSDRDLDDSGDLDAITTAISDAVAECDSYISVKYTIPLPGVTGPSDAPVALKRVCMDIAIYRLARENDVLTEETRKRYDDAVAWLKDLARGNVSLVGITDVVPPTVDGGVTLYSCERVMTRHKIRGAF